MDWSNPPLEHPGPAFGGSAIELLLACTDADHAEHLADGRVVVRWMCALTSADRIVRVFDEPFELEQYSDDELVDASGSGVDIETTTRVDVCNELRIILRSVDHFQAGFCGTLTVYPDQGAYEAALDSIRAEVAEQESWAQA